ncbi:MAG: surface lipoprotein assembly modifier [Thalassovita sp.]
MPARNFWSQLTAVCLSFGLLAAAPAQSEQLSPAQLRAAAVVALDQGRPELALALSEALLKRDAADVMALQMKARATRDLGQFDSARAAARRAWSLSKTEGQKFDSARVMAQALASNKQHTRAQLWLRRAVQNAPDARTRQLAVRDFTYVRARNPLKLSFDFSVSPETNINDGSIRDETQVFDYFTQDYVVAQLQGPAQALSGTRAALALELRYTLSEDVNHRSDFVLRGGLQRYQLSDSAKRAAPTVSGSDFAYDNLDIGLQTRWKQGASGELRLGVLAGAAQYGGHAYSQRLRLDGGYSRALSAQDGLNLSAGAEATRGPRAPHSNLLRVGAEVTRHTNAGGAVIGNTSLVRSQSDHEPADYAEAQLGIEARPTWDLFGATASYGLSLRWRNYDSYVRFSPNGRKDREASAYVTLRFSKVDYMGFTPTVTLSASRNESSVGLFDVDSRGVALSFETAF